MRENIRYGRLAATDEEIEAAAKAVHAHEFIMELPDGYDTVVEERGSTLSAGQRQLIAFARVLLADPRILILDEATSNIDTRTEEALQAGLNHLLKGRTSFIIAHRLSTIENADEIFYIDHGQIMEHGSHDELLAQKGAYYRLYESQYAIDPRRAQRGSVSLGPCWNGTSLQWADDGFSGRLGGGFPPRGALILQGLTVRVSAVGRPLKRQPAQ